MSRFDRNKVSYDLSNNAYSKQIKVVNKSFKSSGVISVNGQDGEVILNYIDQLEKGIPEGVAPLNSEGVIDEQYLPPISSDNFKTINGESILGSGDIEVGSNLTFENGLREENDVVKLGLDTSDPTFTKGILTEDTFIIGGDLSSNSYLGMIILPDAESVSLSVVDNGATHGLSVSNGIIQLERFKSGRQGILFSDIASEVIDEINNKGLQYASDYSTNGKLDDRWIPDWKAVKDYVDENVGSVELGSGLHFDNDGKVALGINLTDFSGQSDYLVLGNLSEDFSNSTSISLSDTEITLSILRNAGTENVKNSTIDLKENSLRIFETSNNGEGAGLDFQNGNISFGKFTSSSAFGLGLSITDTFGFRVIDNINNRGLTYAQDYSANYTDRSLVDKAYVDSKASPFNIIDVTEEFYQDKAINVIPFNNTGMSYSEGAIDFGVTRDETHTMGSYAFKQGEETTATNYASSAFGSYTEASGFASSAFGSSTIASGVVSAAFGNGTEASGEASSAFGSLATASGNYSSAFGFSTTASGYSSSAFGGGTDASGAYSAAFGNSTIASSSYSAAFGYQSTASGWASLAFGFGNTANEYASLAIGCYSTDGAVETSWTTGSPIFKVGNGTDHENKSNAYVLYNDGRSEQIKDVEVTEIGQGFVLKSPDGTRWRIAVDNSGNLTTISL